jgi:hypothetical protein
MGSMSSAFGNRPRVQGWLTKSQDMPSLIWSDAGTGGKKGSIWAVNKVLPLVTRRCDDLPEWPSAAVGADGPAARRRWP